MSNGYVALARMLRTEHTIIYRARRLRGLQRYPHSKVAEIAAERLWEAVDEYDRTRA